MYHCYILHWKHRFICSYHLCLDTFAKNNYNTFRVFCICRFKLSKLYKLGPNSWRQFKWLNQLISCKNLCIT